MALTGGMPPQVDPLFEADIQKVRQELLQGEFAELAQIRGPRKRRLVPLEEDFVSKERKIADAEEEERRRRAEKDAALKAKRSVLVKRIEAFVLQMMTDLANRRLLSLSYPLVSWQQTQFKDSRLSYCEERKKLRAVRMSCKPSRSKLSLLLRLLDKVHGHLSLDTCATKRELFYQFLLPSQVALDTGVTCISSFLQAPPWEYGILSTAKGIVAGALTIHFDHSQHLDCNNAVLIPSNIHKAVDLKTTAKFVLIVEKDAIFQKIHEERSLDHLNPFILITGKGYPDLPTRQLLKMIWDKFMLPVFILVDADPHGIDIMCTYRFGSMTMCQFSHLLAVPATKWVGVHPSDMKKFGFQQNALIALSKKDLALAQGLLKRPYVLQNGRMKQEVEILLQTGFKAEIEALGNLSPFFLTDLYIGNKIMNRDFI